MTALVSWCDSPQSWLSGLPVDEVVPMAFSMGQATAATITMLNSGGSFGFSGCTSSVGVDLPDRQAPWQLVGGVPVRPRRHARAYFFPDARPWTPILIEQARSLIAP
jgi:hypothetical protein